MSREAAWAAVASTYRKLSAERDRAIAERGAVTGVSRFAYSERDSTGAYERNIQNKERRLRDGVLAAVVALVAAEAAEYPAE